MEDSTKIGRIPTLHVVADSIPRAWYRAMKKVWEEGLQIRTEYDRKENGRYIDPPSRDARVLIEVLDPLKQPRYPAVCFCERGKYIAEMLGAKDHLVLPLDVLKKATDTELEATEWPYTYHQRLFSYPKEDGKPVNQIELALERLAKTPYSRRAVASTPLPSVDPYLKEDIPCLREMQLRCPEDEDGNLVLNMTTGWRSRDNFKGWPDNVVVITFLMQIFAKELEQKTGRKVKVGSYADFSYSLHIYGQDFAQVGGDKEKGIKSLFDDDEETFINKCWDSEMARDVETIPQLEKLLTEKDQWKFTPEAIKIMEKLLEDIKIGKYIV